MNLIELIAILIVLSNVSKEESETVRSLCDDPKIHAADRLKNGTYRVYRDNYFWELVGLPDKNAKVKGPYFAWYQYFAPLDKMCSIQTIIGGNADGLTYKYRAEKYWSYRQTGDNIVGGKNGFDSREIPKGGFNAVFNDGGMSGLGYPLMIGFSGIKVFYYNTRDREFRRMGSADGYVGGKDGEKFPSDINAAFAFPSTDSSVKYYVYLFKRDKYCYRPITGEDGCKEWRDSRDLFGCNESSGTSPPNEVVPEVVTEPQPQAGVQLEGEAKPPDPENLSVVCAKNSILLLIAIYFVLKF